MQDVKRHEFKARIGIFDSGIGGKAIAESLSQSFPKVEITIVDDKKNIPYGSKTDDEVIELTELAIQPLIQGNYDIIVIACNTATAVAIDYLRSKYPNVPFIGIEPMVKQAAKATKTKVIGVCATPATLGSKRYKKLLEDYGQDLTIIEPDCSNWAAMIEDNTINQNSIHQIIDELCSKQTDIIVLGCTHYHWIKDIITDIVGERAQILEPSSAISARVAHLLSKLKK